MTVECPSSTTSLLQTVAPLGSWVLVIAGWLFVRRDNNRREARKEAKSLVDSCIARSERLGSMARTYLEGAYGSENAQLSARIKLELKTLGTEVQALNESTKKEITAGRELIALRRAITGGTFDSANRQPTLGTDPVFAEIDDAIVDFHRKMTESFCRLKR